MKNPIGFISQPEIPAEPHTQEVTAAAPRKSLCRVFFPERNLSCTYFNQLFDLQTGDLVFVDGKLEDLQGYVTEVTYSFKIKLSQYQQVIARADTHVTGRFFPAGSHWLTFDSLPREQVRGWFLPPETEETVTGQDSVRYDLREPESLHISSAIAQRGSNYYQENRVLYLSLTGTSGYAIVEGTKFYEVSFSYEDHMLWDLSCTCFCTGTCKHEVALLLQLEELLNRIGDNSEFPQTGSFAALSQEAFLKYVLNNRTDGSLLLSD